MSRQLLKGLTVCAVLAFVLGAGVRPARAQFTYQKGRSTVSVGNGRFYYSNRRFTYASAPGRFYYRRR